VSESSRCLRCQEPLITSDQPCPRCGSVGGNTGSLPGLGTPLEHRAAEVLAGDVLGEAYQVVRKLGEGGMASVFLARDLQLGRQVAVKVLAAHLCRDPQAVARFEREARATAHLDHPNIVPIYAVGRFRDRPFMVMKLLEGGSLADLIHRRPVPWAWSEVRPLLTQLCDGLSSLHARGLVHRDVKPSNIFVSPSGHLTLLDFGIIKELSTDHTGTGQLLGTMRYMAPEQLVQANLVDARADVYAVGVVLYRLLAGRTPFEGDDLQVAQAKVSEDPPSADSLNPTLSGSIASVLSRAVSRERTSRFQSVKELLEALDHPELFAKRRSTRRLAGALVVAASLVATAAITWRLTRVEPLPVNPEPIAVPAPTAPPPPAVEAERPAEPPPLLAHESSVARSPKDITPAPRPTPPPVKPVARGEPPVTRGTLAVQATIRGQPTVAELIVDGVEQGEAPLQLELSSGSHRVRVTKSGYPPVETTVKVGSRPERLVVELAR